ncbi:thioredoxin domain-containing protein 12-like isoform X2 [Littorina saxatilis]|uniref:Thioredoxin domain-containing protein 12 n=1 Tax=Littorina saxatilis TaxID=31220 RepID=A0AAN9B8W7_9CAEN
MGWGDNIDWMTLEKAWQRSKSENLPVFLLIHKSWCGACKAFKPKFAESTEIQKMSEQFVMVNVEDHEEPDGDQYKPDGGYIPRILFFDSEGKLLDDVYNKNGNPKYKYFYHAPEGVIDSMRTVLKRQESNSKVKKEL